MYRPRTQSKKYRDGDCPDGVLAIYDNGGTSADRYTVFYKDVHIVGVSSYIFYRAMSENPMHPQGIGMSGEMFAYQVAQFRDRSRRHACKWSSLPDEVKRCVRLDCEEMK